MTADRAAELRAYAGLSAADAEALLRFRAEAAPRFPAIADEFYALIRMHEGAFAILKDEAQALRLHASLQIWMGELLGGVYDAEWGEHQAHVGEVHVRVGLQPRYVVVAMGHVRASLESIASTAGEAHARVGRAIGRVCDLSLAMMLEGWQEHQRLRIERMSARARSDRAQSDGRDDLLRDALAAGDVVLFVFDADGHALLVNQKAAELTGYAADELEELDCFQVLFGDEAAQMRDLLLVSAAHAPLEAETEAHTRSGKTRLVRWR
ncbi:MAG: protoglobin domain-containing protein, partial [Polyangiaceae bacterium]